MKIRIVSILLAVLLIGTSAFSADSTLTTTNPLPESHSSGSVDGEFLVIATSDLGNANTSYTYFDLMNNNYNAFALGFTIQNTTLTIEGTLDAPTVANASATWTDITDMLTNSVATSFTSTGSLTVSSPIPWNRIRVKRVTTNATNSLKLRLTRMKI